jgi:hypothetical protein
VSESFPRLESKEVLQHILKGEPAIITTRWALLYIPLRVVNLVTQEWIEKRIRECYGASLQEHPFKIEKCRHSVMFRLPPMIMIPDERLWPLRDSILEKFRSLAGPQDLPDTPATPSSRPSFLRRKKARVRLENWSKQPRTEDFKDEKEEPEVRPSLQPRDVRVRLSPKRTLVELKPHLISELGNDHIRNLVEQCFGAGTIAVWIKNQDGHTLWSKGPDGMILILPPIPVNEYNTSNAASKLGHLIKEAYKLSCISPEMRRA